MGGGQPEACASPVLWSGLPDGAYSFSAAAADRLGNAGPRATTAFLIDTTPPDIGNIVFPAATRASSIAVSFSVTDAGSGVNSTSCRRAFVVNSVHRARKSSCKLSVAL